MRYMTWWNIHYGQIIGVFDTDEAFDACWNDIYEPCNWEDDPATEITAEQYRSMFTEKMDVLGCGEHSILFQLD